MAAEQPDVIPPPMTPLGSMVLNIAFKYVDSLNLPREMDGLMKEWQLWQTYVHLGQKRYMR